MRPHNDFNIIIQPPKVATSGSVISGGYAGFLKGGSRKGNEREARAKILATPPPQLVIDHVDNHRACAYSVMLLQPSSHAAKQETF